MKNKLILHRGYKGKYPENSLISFENALKENYDFETDIRLSRDNVAFMIHDDNLDRLFNGTGKISDYDSEELRKFSYKEDENSKLASFEELCELIENIKSDSLIFIHIKELKDIDFAVNILNKYNFKERIRFFACDNITISLIEIIKEKYKDYQVGLHFFENSPHYKKEIFEKADFIWADEINFKWIDKEKVDFSHNLNKLIYAISPELIVESIFNKNLKERWKELLEANVDGICSDVPKEFLEFIQV